MHFSVLLEADSVTGMCTSSSTEQVNMGQDDKTLVWYFQSAGLAELCKSVMSTDSAWVNIVNNTEQMINRLLFNMSNNLVISQKSVSHLWIFHIKCSADSSVHLGQESFNFNLKFYNSREILQAQCLVNEW